jgi:hypothetical protein
MKLPWLIPLALVLAAGCASNQNLPPPGPTIAEIESMAQAQVSDSVIISKIEYSGTRYYLTVDQILELKKAGVSDAVVNAMLKTAQQPPTQTINVYQTGPGYPYYYGTGPYWWGGAYYYRPAPAPAPRPPPPPPRHLRDEN